MLAERGFVIEVYDPQGCDREQRELLEALIGVRTLVDGVTQLKDGKVERSLVPLLITRADPEHEDIDDALARFIEPELEKREIAKGLLALQARRRHKGQTAKRMSLLRAAAAFASNGYDQAVRGPVMLIAAAGADAWMGRAEMAQRAAKLASRCSWLRVVLVGAGTQEAVFSHGNTRVLDVVRDDEQICALGEADHVALDTGSALVEAICHDIAAEGGTRWRAQVCSRWPQSYIFRVDHTDRYQRSMSAEGARAVAHACATALLGANGLAALGRTASAVPTGRLAGCARNISLVRQPRTIDIVVDVQSHGAKEYRGTPAEIAWPAYDPPIRDGYGSCALKCMGLLLGHATMGETARMFETKFGKPWHGEGLSVAEIQAMLQHPAVDVELARSAGETYLHCKSGMIAILIVAEPTHGAHALVRYGDKTYDPGGFSGLGRLWCDGREEVELVGAILVNRRDRQWIGLHTSHFERHTRPSNARQARNVWDYY